jgi:hypothetical protein
MGRSAADFGSASAGARRLVRGGRNATGDAATPSELSPALGIAQRLLLFGERPHEAASPSSARGSAMPEKLVHGRRRARRSAVASSVMRRPCAGVCSLGGRCR